MKSQLGYLDVVGMCGSFENALITGFKVLLFLFTVPPDIVDYQTSHDMVVEEGQNVTLACTAVGLPEPTIEWRREGKKPLLSVAHENG